LECDFCSSPEPKWTCVSTPSIQEIGEFISHDVDGLWAACETCAEIVRKRDVRALATYSAMTFAEKFGFPFSEAMICEFIEQQERFWLGFTGEVREING
jgi:hypothetical protein